MKDYKLSEIKKICQKRKMCFGCIFCGVGGCIFGRPMTWEIDEKDGEDNGADK